VFPFSPPVGADIFILLVRDLNHVHLAGGWHRRLDMALDGFSLFLAR